MSKKIFKVIIPTNLKPVPEIHEIEIAHILAKHYKCDVIFLKPSAGFKIKTPDIKMKNTLWEIKSPTGKSKKNTIESQFRGLKQSRNLVIHSGRTSLSDEHIMKEVKKEIERHKKVGKIIFIAKNLCILEVK